MLKSPMEKIKITRQNQCLSIQQFDNNPFKKKQNPKPEIQEVLLYLKQD